MLCERFPPLDQRGELDAAHAGHLDVQHERRKFVADEAE